MVLFRKSINDLSATRQYRSPPGAPLLLMVSGHFQIFKRAGGGEKINSTKPGCCLHTVWGVAIKSVAFSLRFSTTSGSFSR